MMVRFPSSRQSKKSKFFLPGRIAGQFFYFEAVFLCI